MMFNLLFSRPWQFLPEPQSSFSSSFNLSIFFPALFLSQYFSDFGGLTMVNYEPVAAEFQSPITLVKAQNPPVSLLAAGFRFMVGEAPFPLTGEGWVSSAQIA